MQKQNKIIGRDITKTNNLTDVDIAKKFYHDFKVPENFGSIVSSDDFNKWIFMQRYEGMGTHIDFPANCIGRYGCLSEACVDTWITEWIDVLPWHDPLYRASWNTNRNVIRCYIKSGILTEEYAKSTSLIYGERFKPYSLEVKEHGQSLIITKFSDLVVDNFNKLAIKRQKTIKNQSKALAKDFKALTDVYKIERYDAIMQSQLVEAQNKMRLAFEKACGDILHETVTKTMTAIQESQRQVKKITHGVYEEHDDEDDEDKAA